MFILGAANEGVRTDLEQVPVLIILTALLLTSIPTPSLFLTSIPSEESLSKVLACPATTDEIDVVL